MSLILDKLKEYYKDKEISNHTLQNYVYEILRLTEDLNDFKNPKEIIEKINTYDSYSKKQASYNAIFITLFKTGLIKDKKLEEEYAIAYRDLKNSNRYTNEKNEKEEIAMKITLPIIKEKINDLYKQLYETKDTKLLHKILILEFYYNYPIRDELRTITYGKDSSNNYYDSERKIIFISKFKTGKIYSPFEIKPTKQIVKLIEAIHKIYENDYILGRKYNNILKILKKLLNNDKITISILRKIHVSSKVIIPRELDIMKNSYNTRINYYYRK